jgi:hypothetical protein
VYACNDRLPRFDDAQTEASDVRAANWLDVTLMYTQQDATAVPTAAATFASKLLVPGTQAATGLRPAFVRIMVTPDGTVASPDSVTIYGHATNN